MLRDITQVSPVADIKRNEKYILNPRYRLRRENARILLYSYEKKSVTLAGKYMMLHPRSAILLCLFNGKRAFAEIVEMFCFIIDDKTSMSDAENGLKNILDWLLGENPELLIHAEPGTFPDTDQPSPYDYILENGQIELATPNPVLDFPLSLNFHLNLECNRKCLYCYAPSHIKERSSMPIGRYMELFDEAVANGVGEIQFGGADPLLNPNIIKLTTEVIKRGFDPFISTKQFVSKSLAREFADLGLTTMQISLDSVDVEIAGQLTGCPGYLKIAISSIENLQLAGIDVRIKAVATGLNIDGIPDLCRTVAEKDVVTVLIDAYGRSTFRHNDYLFVPNEKIADCLEKISEINQEFNNCQISTSLEPYLPPDQKQRARNWADRASCSAGRSAMTIMTDGTILVCDQVPIEKDFMLGSVAHSSIKDQWQSHRMREIVYPKQFTLNEPCRSCEDFAKCCTEAGRCVRDVFIAFGTSNDGDPKCPRIDLPNRY